MCNVLFYKLLSRSSNRAETVQMNASKKRAWKTSLSPLHNLLVIFTRRLKMISQYRLLITQWMPMPKRVSKTGYLINRAKVFKPKCFKGKHLTCRLYSVHDCNRMEVLPLNTWNSQWTALKSAHRLRINMLGTVANVWLRERQRGSELKQVFSSCYTAMATCQEHWELVLTMLVT